MGKRSLEARNLALRNAFWFVSISLPVAEISSCKGRGNFWSFITSILVGYSDLSLAPRLTDLSQTARQTTMDSWKKCRSVGREFVRNFLPSLNRYISGTVRDIGINQKVASMGRFSLFPKPSLMTKFLIFLAIFFIENSRFLSFSFLVSRSRSICTFIVIISKLHNSTFV